MGKVRATRHNGRKGKDGVFKAGHNDRTFKVENAEHIDATTINADVAAIEEYEDEILKPSSGLNKEHKNIAKVLLDGAVNLLKRESENIMAIVRDALNNPLIRKKSHDEIAEVAKMSMRERLAQAKIEADIKNAARGHVQKKHERGER